MLKREKEEQTCLARPYRYMKSNIWMNFIYFMVMLVPSGYVYFTKMDNINHFLIKHIVVFLKQIMPNTDMHISSMMMKLFGDVEYVVLPTVYPSLKSIIINLIVAVVIILITFYKKWRGHPAMILIGIIAAVHMVHVLVVWYAGTDFKYTIADFSILYTKQEIGISAAFMIFGAFVTAFWGNSGYIRRFFFFILVAAYPILLSFFRYLVFIYILHQYSIIYMGIMYFALGPIFDFLSLVMLYAFFLMSMSKMYENKLRKGGLEICS